MDDCVGSPILYAPFCSRVTIILPYIFFFCNRFLRFYALNCKKYCFGIGITEKPGSDMLPGKKKESGRQGVQTQSGRGDWIRTSGLYVPNVALYQTEPHLEMAAEEGFEPSQTESESAVLPLHNSAMSVSCFAPFLSDNDIYYSKNFPFVNTLFEKKQIYFFRNEFASPAYDGGRTQRPFSGPLDRGGAYDIH